MKWSSPLSLFFLLAPHIATARFFDRRQASSDATRAGGIETTTSTPTIDPGPGSQPTAQPSWFDYIVPKCARECVLKGGKDVKEDLVAACASLGEDLVKDMIYGCVDDPSYCPKGTNTTEFIQNLETYCTKPISSASSLKQTSTSSKKKMKPASARTTTSSSTSETATRTSTASRILATATDVAEISQESRKKGLSGGAIAGIVIGVLAFLALLGLVAWLVVCKRRNPREQARSMSLEPPSSSSPRLISGPIRPDPSAGWAPMGSTATTPTSWRGFESQSQHSLPISSVGEMRQQDRAPSSLSFGVTVSEAQQQPYSTRTSTPGPAPSTHSFGDAGPYAAPVVVVGGMAANRSSGFLPSLKIDPNPPAFNYTPATPDDREPPSPVSPVTPYAPKRSSTSHESFSSSIVSEDDDGPPMALSGRFSAEPFQQPTSRAISIPPQVSPMTPPPPPHVTSASPTPSGAMSRADSVSWRREVEEAAARASNRVVVSEQEYAEERRESKNQSAFAKLTRRWSDRDEVDNRSSKQRPVSGSSATSSVKARRKSGVMIV